MNNKLRSFINSVIAILVLVIPITGIVDIVWYSVDKWDNVLYVIIVDILIFIGFIVTFVDIKNILKS